ncbi:MAG: hypothetical protein FVQ80_07560 [Planctomycetes bacterium]|nr:hypothetical protein [Planctomycetota bacterium]
MGVKFGEIDSGQILSNEFKVAVLERVVEWLVNNTSMVTPNQLDLQAIRKSVVKELKKKYPKSGIEYKGGS